jgi:hypothetical protein
MAVQYNEYLVSFLSHDEYLCDILQAALYRRSAEIESFGCVAERFIDVVDGWDAKSEPIVYFHFSEQFQPTFTSYVDVIKFRWLLHGFADTLEYIKRKGFYAWSQKETKQLEKYVDELVLIAQKRLRRTETKFSDMAEFFRDRDATKVISLGHVWHEDSPSRSAVVRDVQSLKKVGRLLESAYFTDRASTKPATDLKSLQVAALLKAKKEPKGGH